MSSVRSQEKQTKLDLHEIHAVALLGLLDSAALPSAHALPRPLLPALSITIAPRAPGREENQLLVRRQRARLLDVGITAAGFARAFQSCRAVGSLCELIA